MSQREDDPALTVRWGASRELELAIPLNSVAQRVGPWVQLTHARVTRPTSWVMFAHMQWINQSAALADTLRADFQFRLGVGAVQVPYNREISVAYNALHDSGESNYVGHPAQSMDCYARLRVAATVAGAARVYRASCAGLSAPQFSLVGL